MSVCAVSQWVPPFDAFSDGPTLQFTLRWTGEESDTTTLPMTRPLATRNTHTSGSENQRTNTPKPSQTVGMATVNFPIMVFTKIFLLSILGSVMNVFHNYMLSVHLQYNININIALFTIINGPLVKC